MSEALKRNASPEELDRLVDELRSALSRYLQALAEQAQKNGNPAPDQKSKDGEQTVSDQELDKLLNNIEQLAKSGSKELAEQMLSELKDILERLQAGTSTDNAKQQRMSKMMKDLNELVSKQQKLLDETFKARREQGGNQQNDAFNVSPPGQPMEFGPGIFMAPFGTPLGGWLGQRPESWRRRKRAREIRRPRPAAWREGSKASALAASSTISAGARASCATRCKA